MLVTVEFEQNGVKYKIERGRKPNVLRFFVNDQEQTAEEADDDAQGDSRETQKSIEQLLAMSHTMFKHLVALNTYTEPFLSMKAADQREVIEQLLGITLLSEKSELLKAQIKTIKDNIQQETAKIEATRTANENVQKSIDSLVLKSQAWTNKKQDDIGKFNKAISQLESVNIDVELQAHADIKQWNENDTKVRNLTKQKATLESAVIQAEKSLTKYTKELESLANKTCHACEQALHDHKHEEMTTTAEKNALDAANYFTKVGEDLEKILTEIDAIGIQPKKPITFYDTEAEATTHQSNLNNLKSNLDDKIAEANPYDEQIEDLKNTAIQEITWDTVNELTSVRDHQEFLLKLLTNKDSFIRKKIIDQNLNYLNKRLDYYINKMGLPHQVKFLNDLTVEITQLGQDLDFDNLSRGERNRLILSLSWAFRDVWENLYQHINLLFIDELIDAGMDSAGVEAGIAVLKKMARERNKNIYLISHKDELVGRVNTVLKVVKENGFTSYATDTDYVET
jgi:DNA repair exonuclease SbcCD ATPase subunit